MYFQADVEKHTLAKYLMELTLLDYDMVHYHPSEIAAAALCLSQLLLDELNWVSCCLLAIIGIFMGCVLLGLS